MIVLIQVRPEELPAYDGFSAFDEVQFPLCCAQLTWRFHGSRDSMERHGRDSGLLARSNLRIRFTYVCVAAGARVVPTGSLRKDGVDMLSIG